MKPTILLRRLLAIAGSSLLTVSHSYAADGTWNVDANGLWSGAGNWTPGIADGSGFTASFTNDITADRTVSLDGDRTLTGVVFGDSATGTAGSWILDNNATSTNNLILAGTTPGITVNALGTGKTATISAIIEGTAGLVKSGTGTLVLSGANTYTGTTTINAGTLILQGAAPLNTGRTYMINGGAVMNLNGGATFNTSVAGNSTINGTGTLRLSGGTYSRSNAGGGTLTLALGAGGLIDIQSGAAVSTWYSSVVSFTGNQATLNVDGTINGNNALTIQADALTGAGTINNSAATALNIGVNNGSGTFSGTIQSSASLTKTGTGTQTLSGANTYTGATTVNGGTLLLDKTGTGALASTSALTLGGGTFKVLGKSGAFTTTQTLGALTLNAGGGQIVLDANGGTSTTLTLANSAPTRAAGGTLAVDLSIANTVLTSTLGLAAGTQTNTQAVLGYATVKDATSTGFATNVGGNIVRYTGADELLAASNSSTTNYKITPVGTTTTGSPLLTTAASAAYNSLSIDTSGATGANFLSLNGTVSLTRNALLMTGSNDFTIQSGTQLGAAASEVIVHQAGTGTLTISSLISSGAGSLSKTGGGTLVLTGNNAYTGTTTISGGELRLSGGAFTTTAGRTYQINSGAVMSLGASGTINSGTTTTIQGTGTLRVLNGVNISGGGGTGSNGRITMNLGAGALIDVQAGGSFGLGFQPIIWTNNKASLNMDGNHNMWDDNAIVADALTGSGTIGSSATGGSTSLTIGTANGSGTFSGPIVHGLGGGTRTIALTKNGTGTQTLSGANTYIGATTISAGTLLVNGTHITTTGGAGYAVSGGSTLGGTGRIAINGSVSVASTAILSPGASIGTLALDGVNTTGNVLSMATGSKLGLELDASGGTPDQLAFWNYLSGDLTLNSNTIDLSLLGTQAAGTYNVDIFRFFSNAGTTATTHAFSSGLTIGTLGTGISTASIDWNGTGDNSQTIALNYTVIPEPQSALLGGLGLLMLLRRRRS